MKDGRNVKEELEKDKRSLFKAQKTSLYWLLGLIYVSFIGMQLGRVQAITEYNYSVHEMLYLPVTLSAFLVPIVFLIYMYFAIKYLRKQGIQKPNINTSIEAVIVIISLITIFSLVNYQSNEVSTGGVFKVEQKIQEDTKYFLILNEKKIRVSRNEFYLVDLNKEYLGTFIWNSQTNRGRLETIEPILK
ncbi:MULTISPECIES: hypothetical protein [unclassified Mesobacillus]|uniref:hypothetical protein n=1 Tax=unclassified Mesobacillus TaxID=2675270 RepID=UPI00203E3536|nr:MULTISPECIES: hypothetical protein [unclassified Mesobacillus]MCM3126106.1 hypothetical protein [Mesobacillus sp. MER 33]MCM3235975.1 hypothetical protein [Mesobacillus sp. MER 48]